MEMELNFEGDWWCGNLKGRGNKIAAKHDGDNISVQIDLRKTHFISNFNEFVRQVVSAVGEYDNLIYVFVCGDQHKVVEEDEVELNRLVLHFLLQAEEAESVKTEIVLLVQTIANLFGEQNKLMLY